MKKLIGITRTIPEAGILYLKDKGYELKVWPDALPPNLNELKTFFKDCDGLISMLSDQLNEDSIKNLPQLKIISNFAVGHNNIDLNFCHKNKIKVTNTPDVLTEATAELTLALLLSVSRLLPSAQKNVLAGEWKTWVPTGFIGQGLQGKTLGIIGPGRIAHEFARKCYLAFDMNINYYGRSPNLKFESDFMATKSSLKDLLNNSDVISIHCPLNDKTKGLISKNEIDQMRDNCILINTARGEIINQSDLEESLKTKKFFGIGLDVTSPEPIALDSPLLRDERVLITPHIGSANQESRTAMSLLCAKNIHAYFQKTPLLSEVTNT